MIQFVRDLWVSTLHSCGEVEQSMREITATARLSIEQHAELGSSHCNIQQIHGFNSSIPSISRM